MLRGKRGGLEVGHAVSPVAGSQWPVAGGRRRQLAYTTTLPELL